MGVIESKESKYVILKVKITTSILMFTILQLIGHCIKKRKNNLTSLPGRRYAYNKEGWETPTTMKESRWDRLEEKSWICHKTVRIGGPCSIAYVPSSMCTHCLGYWNGGQIIWHVKV